MADRGVGDWGFGTGGVAGDWANYRLAQLTAVIFRFEDKHRVIVTTSVPRRVTGATACRGRFPEGYRRRKVIGDRQPLLEQDRSDLRGRHQI